MRKFLNYDRAFLGAALFSIASRGRWLMGLLCCTVSLVGATVPDAPTAVSGVGTVFEGKTQALVSFTAPVSNGGAAISSYTVPALAG